MTASEEALRLEHADVRRVEHHPAHQRQAADAADPARRRPAEDPAGAVDRITLAKMTMSSTSSFIAGELSKQSPGLAITWTDGEVADDDAAPACRRRGERRRWLGRHRREEPEIDVVGAHDRRRAGRECRRGARVAVHGRGRAQLVACPPSCRASRPWTRRPGRPWCPRGREEPAARGDGERARHARHRARRTGPYRHADRGRQRGADRARSAGCPDDRHGRRGGRVVGLSAAARAARGDDPRRDHPATSRSPRCLRIVLAPLRARLMVA